MEIDLDRMSHKELQKLRKDVDRALETLDDRRRSEARAAAERAVREHGFSLDDILGQQKKSSGRKNPAKYRNPENSSQTWSGLGRQPAWIKEALASGRSLDEFSI